MKRTADEIAADLGVTRAAADGLIKFLQEVKLLQFCGERPNPNGRGKGAHVYLVPAGTGEAVGVAVAKLED